MYNEKIEQIKVRLLDYEKLRIELIEGSVFSAQLYR